MVGGWMVTILAVAVVGLRAWAIRQHVLRNANIITGKYNCRPCFFILPYCFHLPTCVHGVFHRKERSRRPVIRKDFLTTNDCERCATYIAPEARRRQRRHDDNNDDDDNNKDERRANSYCTGFFSTTTKPQC